MPWCCREFVEDEGAHDPTSTAHKVQMMYFRTSSGGVVFGTVWEGDGYDGEPLLGPRRLEQSNALSTFTRTDVDADGTRQVVVLNLELGGGPAVHGAKLHSIHPLGGCY